MKKLILVMVASMFVFTMADAQMFSWGIKGGIGFSSINMDDITGIEDGDDVYDLVTGDAVTGYHVGLQSQIKLAFLLIRPELYFNAGGGTVEQIVEGGATEVLNVKFSRIDLPVLVGFKLGPVRINAGPVGSVVTGESSDLDDLQSDFEVYTNAMTFGFQGGLGLDISKLTLDVRYEGSISALGDSFTVGGVNFPLDARPAQWMISLGFMF